MAARRQTPTVRLRRLAAEMRRLRASSGLTREEAAERTSIDPATIYRIETARARRPQKRTLTALFDLYGLDAAGQEQLLALSRAADTPGAFEPYHDELPEDYATYIGFEAEARVVSTYESLFVPGLLQTEDYARAVVRGGLPMADEDVDRRVRARMERQVLLTRDDPLHLWAVIDESAIHRLVGGVEVMQAQLRRLAAAAGEPHVTLQVIPYSAGAHAGMHGSFTLLDFADPGDPAVVYIESMAGDLFLESDAEISRYRTIFDSLRAAALSPDDTTRLIAAQAGTQ